MKITAFTVLCLVAFGANAFKVEERRDEFTKASYVSASDLKICQVKSAGFAARCASIDLVWSRDEPGVVGIRMTQPDIQSITAIAVNIDGTIHRYGADVGVTDFNYDESLGRFASFMAWSSTSTFALPVRALEAIASDEDSGIIRVLGTHAATDFDFYRKAKARGLPADELRQFLEFIRKP